MISTVQSYPRLAYSMRLGRAIRCRDRGLDDGPMMSRCGLAPIDRPIALA